MHTVPLPPGLILYFNLFYLFLFKKNRLKVKVTTCWSVQSHIRIIMVQEISFHPMSFSLILTQKNLHASSKFSLLASRAGSGQVSLCSAPLFVFFFFFFHLLNFSFFFNKTHLYFVRFENFSFVSSILFWLSIPHILLNKIITHIDISHLMKA